MSNYLTILRHGNSDVLSTAALNYRHVRSWLPLGAEEKSIQVPLRELEMALIEAFDLQAVSILGRAKQLYVNRSDINFQENDWNHEANNL